MAALLTKQRIGCPIPHLCPLYQRHRTHQGVHLKHLVLLAINPQPLKLLIQLVGHVAGVRVCRKWGWLRPRASPPEVLLLLLLRAPSGLVYGFYQC
jgi:hypothetical protein